MMTAARKPCAAGKGTSKESAASGSVCSDKVDDAFTDLGRQVGDIYRIPIMLFLHFEVALAHQAAESGGSW